MSTDNTLLPSHHTITTLSGSPRACGRAYGHQQAEAIEAFLHMEVAPSPQRRRYAARCWELVQRWDRSIAEFTRGMAAGAGIDVADATLLLAHEEIVHIKHCTGIGATRAGTHDGHPIVGQTWDWSPILYPWSSLTRLAMDDAPRALLYSFPGLWASAGINEHGLSLVWTGAAYSPIVRSAVGIPTYALIAAILARRTCAEALDLLRRTTNAGSFIFFLADATGEVVVVEGLPRRIEVTRCEDVISRANHYETARMVRLSGQDFTKGPRHFNSPDRAARMAALARRHAGAITRHHIEAFLRDRRGAPGRRICSLPSPTARWIAVDSFYCLPDRRELWIARGRQDRHAFQRHCV
jgi:hypothetical protein